VNAPPPAPEPPAEPLASFDVVGRLPVMAWMGVRDGRRTHFSRRWLEFTGRTLEQEQGDGWLQGVHPDDRPRVEVSRPRQQPTEREHLIEYRLRRRDGSWREIVDVAVPVLGAGGDLEAWVGTCRDVTQHRRAQRERRESDVRFDATFFEAPIGMALVDTSGRILRANPALGAILLRPPEDLAGAHLFDFQKPDVAIAARALLAQAARGEGRLLEQRWHLVRADGVEVPALVSAALVRDAEASPQHWILQVQDVSAREEAEEALRQSEDRLRHAQKMEALGRLADGIAHEFGNIQFIVHGHATRLLDRLDPGDPLRASVAQILQATERTADLTGRLQALGRGRARQAAVFDVGPLLDDMVRILQRTLGEDVVLTALVEPGLPAVRADPGEIQQVLLDLALVAREAMPRGGRLRIEARDVTIDEAEARQLAVLGSGRHLLVSVAHGGRGLDAEARARIFEPFSTAEASTRRPGFGLSLAYGAARRAGGDILVDGTPYGGTTFSIYLPAHAGAAPETSATVEVGRQALIGSGRILVAEDEDLVRDLIVAILEGLGYETAGARDGLDAAALLEAPGRPFDLLIADVVMPRSGGVDLAAAARARRADLPVLYISGYRDHPAFAGAGLDGRSDFLAKPFSPLALGQKVRELLSAGPTSGPSKAD
jgi:PAS domain S-box-containing protein